MTQKQEMCHTKKRDAVYAPSQETHLLKAETVSESQQNSHNSEVLVAPKRRELLTNRACLSVRILGGLWRFWVLLGSCGFDRNVGFNGLLNILHKFDGVINVWPGDENLVDPRGHAIFYRHHPFFGLHQRPAVNHILVILPFLQHS